MRLELREVLVVILFLLTVGLVGEYDDATCLVAKSNVVACRVETHARNDVLIDDALPWSLVPEYLGVLVVCALAAHQFFHHNSSIMFIIALPSMEAKRIFPLIVLDNTQLEHFAYQFELIV
jgi:hypothetical protein